MVSATSACQPGADGDVVPRERFGAYFPRVFAYALAMTGDEFLARELTIAAFSETFLLDDMADGPFATELFRRARGLARAKAFRRRDRVAGLSPDERDALSLVFDARLSRAQISEVMGIERQSIASLLLRGLQKTKQHRASPAHGRMAAGLS